MQTIKMSEEDIETYKSIKTIDDWLKFIATQLAKARFWEISNDCCNSPFWDGYHEI